MWSDRVSPEKFRELVEQLRSVEFSSEPPLATISYRNGVAAITSSISRINLKAPAFDILEAALIAWRGSNARLTGYLGYDLAAELENLGPLPPDDLNMPEMYFRLSNSMSGNTSEIDIAVGTLKAEALSSKPDRTAFEESVSRIVETIYAGDIFQTNLCRRIETRLESGSAWDLFQRMREINPARYEAFIQIDSERAVLSISPESFLKVTNRHVESSPIKGTRPRGKSLAADEKLAAELRSSEKDRAELAMIVDVVRNDLGRVCEIGSVRVAKHAEMMTIPTVHHLYSTVTGKLRDDVSSVDLLRAAFPAASISGAPKIEAMRVAMREEKQLRGPCMGAIGWISMNGDMDLSVAIRTAFVAKDRVLYYAGCGITADSVPSDEFQESEHKAAAFVRALGVTLPMDNG